MIDTKAFSSVIYVNKTFLFSGTFFWNACRKHTYTTRPSTS